MVEPGVLAFIVESEIDRDISQGVRDMFRIMDIDHVTNEVQGDGAIHGPGVDMHIMEAPGQCGGQRAFATRRIAVDGNDDLALALVHKQSYKRIAFTVKGKAFPGGREGFFNMYLL